jgi:hypothetical protein
MSEVYSYHVFLFPFKLHFSSKCNNRTLTPDSLKWKHKPFKIEKPENFNEYVYFYDFVREAIYDVDKLVQCFEYKLPDKTKSFTPYYKIGIGSRYFKCPIDYNLTIDKIELAIYKEEEIGILSFFLQNNFYPQQQDILNINDFGKRIYPQFLAIDSKKEGTTYTKVTQEVFLAKEISLFLTDENTPTFKTDFANFAQIDTTFEEEPLIANFITGLLDSNVKSVPIKSTQTPESTQILISPLLDDRMFVLCWYGNNELSNQYSQNRGNNYGYLQDDFWYQFLFMDNQSPTCQSDFMHVSLIKNATNERWVNYGTLYGVTRYSFVLLTDKGEFGKQTLLPHLKTMYTKIVMLSLVQRGAILKFSRELVTLSNLTLPIVSTQAADLHKRYIQFVNKSCFREVTAQEQGIELYDLLQKQMRIAEQVKDLDKEIAELHNYVSLLEDKERNKEAAILNKEAAILNGIATRYLPISITLSFGALLVGFFGMNTMPEASNVPNYLFSISTHWAFWISSLIVFVLSLLIWKVLARQIKN